VCSESCKHGSERGLSKPTIAIWQGGSFLLYAVLVNPITDLAAYYHRFADGLFPATLSQAPVWAGKDDAIQYHTRFWRASIGGSPDEVPQEYFKRSALNWADEIDTPLLILHGALDFNVPYSDSGELYDRINTAGGEAALLFYSGAGDIARPEMMRDALNWLRAR